MGGRTMRKDAMLWFTLLVSICFVVARACQAGVHRCRIHAAQLALEGQLLRRHHSMDVASIVPLWRPFFYHTSFATLQTRLSRPHGSSTGGTK